jgi:hypothetical protein
MLFHEANFMSSTPGSLQLEIGFEGHRSDLSVCIVTEPSVESSAVQEEGRVPPTNWRIHDEKGKEAERARSFTASVMSGLRLRAMIKTLRADPKQCEVFWTRVWSKTMSNYRESVGSKFFGRRQVHKLRALNEDLPFPNFSTESSETLVDE